MATAGPSLTLEQIVTGLDQVIALPAETLERDAVTLADRTLALAENILETWLLAHGRRPTARQLEGFRLLGLHRQGAKGDPSFNACRETCRELVYRRNLIVAEPEHAKVAHRLRVQAMVARHLALFIGGKIEIAGLGEFCCSSRPLRAKDTQRAAFD